MRVLLLLCLVVVAVSAKAMGNSPRELWESFKTTHGKSYKTAVEDRNRMQIFFQNLKKIEEHNKLFEKGEKTFTMGTNRFADWTHEEFLSTMLPAKRSQMKRFVNHATGMFVKPVGFQAPVSVDWRTDGYVTPVKDQGNCGSCWAFSTTGAIEGSHFKVSGELISLSEQNLMDCTYDYGNAGCGGGYQEYAFDYVAANQGIDTEESYPYQERDGTCRYDPAFNAASVTGYTSILPRGDESVQLEAVADVGPISVSMDASLESFQLYSSGIYYDPLCKNGFFELDHGILAVGYGSENGEDYWIVKNSWGTSWGEEGYFNMARNRDNNCGIATDSLYGTGPT